jgi:hypothetical protein
MIGLIFHMLPKKASQLMCNRSNRLKWQAKLVTRMPAREQAGVRKMIGLMFHKHAAQDGEPQSK